MIEDWTKQVDFEALASKFGTPLYVYSEERIARQFHALSSALEGVRHLIAYAVKANSAIAVLKIIRELGGGFDIVSEGELRRVLQAGGDPGAVVYAGVGKTDDEIRFALSQNIKFFNVESESELKRIDALARNENTRARISFRINPDVSVDAHPHLATGLRSSKFGIAPDVALGLWEYIAASPVLELVAVDCHIGTTISDMAPVEEAYTKLLGVAKAFCEKGAAIETVDFGGGFGISYSGHMKAFDLAAFSTLVKRLAKDTPYEFVFEPGRYLVAEAGVLLSRVVHTKRNYESKFAVLDAGMNTLIRPSLYGSYHKIENVAGKSAAVETINVVGPICESGCFFAKDRSMPALAQGDLALIRDAGAYGSTMASRYNSYPLPAEVLLKRDGSASLIRKREDFDQLWMNEQW